MQTAASAAAHPRAHRFESSSAAFKKYLFIVISEDTGMKSSLLGLSLSSVDLKSKSRQSSAAWQMMVGADVSPQKTDVFKATAEVS